MTSTIDLDGDGENMRAGLLSLVLAIVEILEDSLEREALRRMESGQLDDDEIERLGQQLARLEAEIERLEREEGIEEDVAGLRSDLDSLIDDAIWDLFDDDAVPGVGTDGGKPGMTDR
ncbi:gas vesicle protein K [Natrinema longum]|uniref:Gas vesicle protein K n=1 Tax=Natrinema longum TaxID=370324 RepID=A0A8A2U5Z0_9EURY|nr:gas vesicle protein K [Natrinema longum]MBZ6494605.1 gas vesicle protein K [Natrinema longum]QSW84076.1 gas vesicle protein K [Natrinema longum]